MTTELVSLYLYDESAWTRGVPDVDGYIYRKNTRHSTSMASIHGRYTAVLLLGVVVPKRTKIERLSPSDVQDDG